MVHPLARIALAVVASACTAPAPGATGPGTAAADVQAGDAAVTDGPADAAADGPAGPDGLLETSPETSPDASQGTGTDASLDGSPDTQADAGWPDLQAPVHAPTAPLGAFYVTIRTGNGLNDGTNDPFQLCLADKVCWDLDNPEINDREAGAVDHHRLAGKGLTKSTIDRVRLQAVSGTNAWMPTCVAVVADGELLFCQDGIVTKLSTQGGDEQPAWQAPNPKLKACGSCYPSGKVIVKPMVGHTSATSTRLWFHASASWPAQLEAAPEPTFGNPVVGAPVLPAQADGFMAEAQVAGLQPATPYWLRLKVDGQVVHTTATPVPTAPAAGGKATFAFVSCAKNDDQPGFGAIDALKPNGLLMIGDNHYGNTGDLDHLRWWYRRMHARTHFADLAARTPTWAIWDDHDFVGNNTNGKAAGKDNALQAFGEAWANSAAGTAQTKGVFHQFTWGDAEFFLTDGRYWRDVEGDLLGKAQTAWLKAALKASKAPFKLVGCGSRFTLKGSGDSWAVYPEAQKALIDYVFAEKIGGLVFLSGDIHRHEVRKIHAGGPGAYPLHELTSSPIANLPSLCKPPDGELLLCAAENGFGWLDIDGTAKPALLTHQVRDEKGKVLYTLKLSAAELQVNQ
ncbi:MAG: alkaline phosphatase family protein [Deltaproteobacteria bacterium]|nr:alkaline phosphatase family protein [Deltaproteobacteria bacterium]